MTDLYGRLPIWIIQHLPKMSGSGCKVLLAIVGRWRTSDPHAYPGVDGLMRDTELSRRSVQLALAELRDIGIITSSTSCGRGNAAVIRPGKGATQCAFYDDQKAQPDAPIKQQKAQPSAPIAQQKAQPDARKGATPCAKRRTVLRPDIDRKKQKDTSAAPASKPKHKTRQKAGVDKPVKSRQPDLIWDTVADIWFEGTVAKPHASRVGKIVRDLRALDATPAEIQTRIDRYRRKWPRASATPEALVKHWTTFSEADADEDDGLVVCRPADPDDPRLDIAYPQAPEGRP